MNLMGLFRSPQNELEKGGKQLKNPQEEQHEITMTCPKCGTQTPVSELWDDLNVCRCGHHFRMTARQRISFLADDDTFTELDADMTSHDILEFPNYENKLKSARLATREKEAVVCGTAKVMGEDCAVFCMDPHFMMGSMGTVVGEKITRLFEYATEHRLSVYGGRRRQNAGGHFVFDADGENERRGTPAQRCRALLSHCVDRPHNGRRDGELCHGRRRHHGGA